MNTDSPAIPFHLAFPVRDLNETRTFYEGVLGCPVGRTNNHWIDFNFFGHQITAHVSPSDCAHAGTNPVDRQQVPVRHFGAVLPWDDWEALSSRVSEAGIRFRIEPHVRFAGEVGEQGTFFVEDPSGNCLEFKSFQQPDRLFAAE